MELWKIIILWVFLYVLGGKGDIFGRIGRLIRFLFHVASNGFPLCRRCIILISMFKISPFFMEILKLSVCPPPS